MIEITYQMVLSTLQTVGLLVGIFYYVTTLRNQNKARNTQLYMQIANKFGEQAQLEARNKYDLFDWLTAEDLIKDFGSLEGRKTIGTLGCYYESLGILVKEKLLDIRIIALFMTGNVIAFWDKMKPFISEMRELIGWERAFVETEYLYYELMKYLEEHPELAT
jgi:hypothetical protein